MGTLEHMRNLVEDIINSYELRIKTIGNLMAEAAKLLQNFRIEQEEMANKLRDVLAKNRSLRKKDFDNIMASIRARRKESEAQVNEMLQNFQQEEKNLVTSFRKLLASGSRMEPSVFTNLKEEIFIRQKERERKVTEKLIEFHQEQEELSSALNKLVAKGESVRIKDFKAVIKAVKVRHKQRELEVDKMLDELWRVREAVSADWQKVLATTKVGKSDLNRGSTAFPMVEQK